MPKFFVDPENIFHDTIKIIGEDVNHIKKVLRLKYDDNIILGDGNGTDYLVSVESFEKDCVLTKILSSSKNTTEPPVAVTLLQGIPKSDKMDLIIQKSVELGVKRIVPVITDRTVIKFDNKRDADNKAARWQRIALEAAKQCNRGIIPKVETPLDFKKSMEMMNGQDLCIIPFEKEISNRLRSCISGQDFKSISVIIGPEGGFSDDEIDKAVLYGVRPVTLGPRILRTETAGLAVLSIIMYELGDVG